VVEALVPTFTHYRHTQVGWVILGVVGAGLLMAVATMPRGAGLPGLGFMAGLLAVILVLFGTLTVEVGGDAIRLRFGIGLIRKRIPLAEVSGWRAVRNPWYAGWGIRLGPRGVLWNVSGRDAVELDLPRGRRFRIGTDEPAELATAITRATGVAPSAPPPVAPGEASPAIAWARWLPAIALGLALVGGLFWLQMRPPRVSVSAQGLEIDTPFYGTRLPAADIVAVSLEPRLPRVQARTNGFSAAGCLRGHFRLEGLGDGRLYVEQGSAPYVLVRLRQGFVVVSFRDPERTQALFDELARLWPDRVSPPAPRASPS
jgi:hypothetical protein